MDTDALIATFLSETQEIAMKIDQKVIAKAIAELKAVRARGGRLFILGVGGSAGNASHAVNDFRKLAGIEAYAPTDNVSELTARTNDEGWNTVFSEWLKVSRASHHDLLLIFSVGGGNREKNISPNLVEAIEEAKARRIDVMGVVGRDGGYTKKYGQIVLVIPTINPERITPHTEAFQAVVWHALVSDPRLAQKGTKWESVSSTPMP